MVVHEFVKRSSTCWPNRKTVAAMTAAIAKISKPYSTADAPVSGPCRPRIARNNASLLAGARVLDRVTGGLEHGLDLGAEQEHDRDDNRGDREDQQAVLDRRRAGVRPVPAANCA